MIRPGGEGTNLGVTVRRLREERNLSIAALARASGMHPTYLSRIERGVCDPTLEKVFGIADALGVPTARLTADDGESGA